MCLFICPFYHLFVVFIVSSLHYISSVRSFFLTKFTIFLSNLSYLFPFSVFLPFFLFITFLPSLSVVPFHPICPSLSYQNSTFPFRFPFSFFFISLLSLFLIPHITFYFLSPPIFYQQLSWTIWRGTRHKRSGFTVYGCLCVHFGVCVCERQGEREKERGVWPNKAVLSSIHAYKRTKPVFFRGPVWRGDCCFRGIHQSCGYQQQGSEKLHWETALIDRLIIALTLIQMNRREVKGIPVRHWLLCVVEMIR